MEDAAVETDKSDYSGVRNDQLGTVLTDISLEKIKAGVFDGPQIKRLLNDKIFIITKNGIEEAAWSGFKAVVQGFLGNRRDDNYKELVQNMLKSYEALGVNMSNKVHYLNSHLNKFPDNPDAYSDEQGERFHQDMKVMEERYQGVWDCHMMADYCWNLSRDLPEYTYKRKAKMLSYFLPHPSVLVLPLLRTTNRPRLRHQSNQFQPTTQFARILQWVHSNPTASFAKCFVLKLAGQASLEEYYRGKTALGMQLGLPQKYLLRTWESGTSWCNGSSELVHHLRVTTRNNRPTCRAHTPAHQGKQVRGLHLHRRRTENSAAPITGTLSAATSQLHTRARGQCSPPNIHNKSKPDKPPETPQPFVSQEGLPCQVYCDASTFGIAGILKQVDPDGKTYPVQYFSRALRSHERNYSISELECLEIFESVDKFRVYLMGRKFTIFSDHYALQIPIKNPSGRLFRWRLRLSSYEYERLMGSTYGELGQPPEAKGPFDLLSLDTIAGFSKYGNAKAYLHVVVDHFSRYTWTFPSKSTIIFTYQQVLKRVLQDVSPKRLLTDRAPAFTSPRFRSFLLNRSIHPLLTTSNNPQANGLCERLNATLTGKLRLLHLENPKVAWTKLVKRVTTIYNNAPHSITGFPPIY
ncbi:hypothetical protein LAZ67_4002439 [Cordylochernes scorpioides]|uniref:Integrase catalytic domain-containing protein n=1 Tax=Cordylochernes scorpioides TaxID=51811 RepID=A0ABY6KEK0_9ARAC|nr:hypothetical protein LAZ67_4002439 [Cordylochernes scorpioides]